MVRNFIVVFCLSLWSMTFVLAQSESRLVLLGVALEEDNKSPLSYSQVLVTDIITNIQDTVFTQKDGKFLANLQADKHYEVTVLDDIGNILYIKPISTINKRESEILYALFCKREE